MIRRTLLALACAIGLATAFSPADARAQQAFQQNWGRRMANQDWNRFYHYPYVYYPQNYWGSEYYRSSGDMYHRYPQEMQIPVYNRAWHNYYPEGRLYHSGHHFILDVF